MSGAATEARVEPFVGRPLDRIEGPLKVSGAAQYSAEYPLAQLTHGAVVHATIARGRITAIDTSAALAMPGVLTVITHQNAPAMHPTPALDPTQLFGSFAATNVTYLNTDEVHWNGQPIAVVVAETLDAALEAAASVVARYAEVPAAVDFPAAAATVRPDASRAASAEVVVGDPLAALAAAEVSVDLHFTTPPQHHNALETHATTAAWDGDRLVVHDGTQNIDRTREHLAVTFGVPLDDVRVVARFVGGAFGGKTTISAGTVLAALAARVVRRPVRLSLTREGVYRTVGGRSPTVQRVALGATRDGILTSLVHTGVVENGRVGGTPEPVTSQTKHLYATPNMLAREDIVVLDRVSNSVMRAPGESVGSFALESAMDELAWSLGIDPIALRMRNEPAVSPASGVAFSHRRLREAFAWGAELFGWADRARHPGAMRDGDHLVGHGVASAYHPAWQFLAHATVRLDAAGEVLVRCGFHDMGMGGAISQAQIAADALGVDVARVRVDYGTSDEPVGPGAGGSAQTASVAGSLLSACERLVGSLHELAAAAPESPLHGSARADVVARGGGLVLRDRPEVGEGYGAVLSRAGRGEIEVAVGSDTPEGLRRGREQFLAQFVSDLGQWAKAACGAHFCEVRVDVDTGEVRVTRWLGVFDVGRVINPKMVASQLRGGIVMGLGLALGEETLVDPRNGRIMNANLADYHVPVHADVPPIDVRCLDDPDPTMPLGILGVGEVGITGVGAAVANAVRHATGRRVLDLPITLDKLL